MSAQWPVMPADLRLGMGEIHLFLTATDLALAMLDYFQTLLTDEDKERMGRYRVAEKQREALVSRGLLRHVLAHFLKRPAKEFVFEVNANGKPYLAGNTLFFNLSHTKGRVILAVSGEGEVGVDIETLGRGVSHKELAERFFTAGEFRALQQLPAAERARGFLYCWTRKEAVLKAMGRGIGAGLDSFAVPVVKTQGPVRVGEWWVHDLEMEAEYAGALATNCEAAKLRFWSPNTPS